MTNNQFFQHITIKEENVFEIKQESNDVDIETDNLVKHENFFAFDDYQTLPLTPTKDGSVCNMKQEHTNIEFINNIFKSVEDYPYKDRLPSVMIKEENIPGFKLEPNDSTTQTDIFFNQEEFNISRDNFEDNQSYTSNNFNTFAIKIECDLKNNNLANTIKIDYDSPTIISKDPQCFECDICGKKFVHKLRLSTHIKTHIKTQIKPTTFACHVCKLKFSYASSLYYHNKVTHSTKKPFMCGICEMKFAHKSHLSDHMKIHTGDKPFDCNVCGKKFARNSLLTCHKRIHTGEKPYKCDICEKTFSQSTHLCSHRKIHTGEKPHKCDICMKTFVEKSNFLQHSRTHQDKNSFKCNNCQLTFSYQSSLTHHVKTTHHEEKQFGYSIHKKKFGNKSNVTKCIKMHKKKKKSVK